MATEQQVRESLEEILTVGAMPSPVKLNLVCEIMRYSMVQKYSIASVRTSSRHYLSGQNKLRTFLETNMTDEFDELEKQIMAAMKEIYTETVIDHAMNPRNIDKIPNPDGFGSATSTCGETMEIRLKAKDGRITDAAFWTNGCSTTIACGSTATETIKGEDVAQALAIKQSDILEALGGLPESNHHCALLAASAVKAAVKDYIAIRKEPWKKAYRKC